MHESERVRPDTGHATAHNSVQRSWRTIETAWRNIRGLIIGASRKAYPDDGCRPDRDGRRHHAGEIGMQCATGVGEISAVMVGGIRSHLRSIVVVDVILMAMRHARVHARLGVGARRRHHARQLGHQEQAHQHMDKPRCGAESLHSTCILGLAGQCVNAYARSAIRSRTSACRSSDHTYSQACLARSAPIAGEALARNFASMAASLIGLAAVPLA
jgi:hypothetical protein